MSTPKKQIINRERWEILERLESWLEIPMTVLAFVWLVLFIMEIVRGLSPLLQITSNVIWIIFIVDFAIRFTLAPKKLSYLRHNWLTAISLLVPALRVFRIVRVIRVLRLAQAARGLQLLRLVTSLNRGMKALGKTMGRHGVGYAAALTSIVLLAGAAGMYAFENNVPAPEGPHSYSAALWWTAMLVATVGTNYSPQTPEGRVLALMLTIYGLAIFGYLTAALASFFIGPESAQIEQKAAEEESLQALRAEIAALRVEVRALRPPEAEEH